MKCILLIALIITSILFKGYSQDTKTNGSVERFRDSGKGTIEDTKMKLAWTRNANPSGKVLNWDEASDYLKAMNSGSVSNFGYTDWRLATKDELKGLFDVGQNPDVNPFTNIQNGWCWSSSTTNLNGGTWFILVGIGGGTSRMTDLKSSEGLVWPVRELREARDSMRASTGGSTSTIDDAESTGTTQSGFKIISVRRSKEYPPPPNTMLKARDGYVFVAVAFVPVPLNSMDDFADDHATFLIDSDGEKHGIAYTEVVGSQKLKNGQTVPEYQCLVFPMIETAKPKKMLVKTSEIDLTKIKEQLPTSTTPKEGKETK